MLLNTVTSLKFNHQIVFQIYQVYTLWIKSNCEDTFHENHIFDIRFSQKDCILRHVCTRFKMIENKNFNWFVPYQWSLLTTLNHFIRSGPENKLFIIIGKVTFNRQNSY